MNCPACRPRPANEEICDDCKRILARGFYVLPFLVMEAGFGAAITLAAIRQSYLALGMFVFAAIVSAVLTCREL